MRATAILRDRVTQALIAGAVLVVGAVALFWPVYLNAYDRWGFRIGCGTSFASSYDQATFADPHGGYLEACQSAVLWRRAWGTATAGLGAGALLVLLTRR